MELTHMSTSNTDDNSNSNQKYSPVLPSTKSILDQDRKSGWSRRYKQTFNGWRFGVLHFTAWAVVVFLINIVATIWGGLHQKSKGSLSEGDCDDIKNMNRGLHIIINVLSTILLSGSNYCMQCLSAPTRTDVDRAHASRTWLDIGIPSIRNLKHISRRRLYLWLLLGLSSVPLHLLYNSAVYASISTNDYSVYLVDEAFLDDATCSNCTELYSPDESGWIPKYAGYSLKSLWTQSRDHKLDKLEPSECIAAYATALQSVRRNLLLVMDSAHAKANPPDRNLTGVNNTNTYWSDSFYAISGATPYEAHQSYRWICSGLDFKPDSPCANRVDEIKHAPEAWKVGGTCSESPFLECNQPLWPVKYCLSEPAVPRCKLRFSSVLAAIVTVLNFFKAVLMCLVIYSTREDPLMTMGDAVASFLDKMDSTTIDSSLLTLRDCKSDYKPGVKPWHNRRSRWKDTTSIVRRCVTLGLFGTALVAIIIPLELGGRAINADSSLSSNAIFSLGFGAVDTRALVRGKSFPTDMISLVLIANLPQVILSFLYFAYNGMFTAMLLSYEWASYASKRKGLRVSRVPSGLQRSTYFLQLPYRFGLPVVILSGTLHWMVSQSIFVVSIDRYNRYEKYLGATNACGYSPIAMLVVILLGIFMMASVLGFGYIPYKGAIPLAGSCSLAISAACHPDEDTNGETITMSEEKLQWGVVSTSVDGVGHCAFSSKDVGPLVAGRMYA